MSASEPGGLSSYSLARRWGSRPGLDQRQTNSSPRTIAKSAMKPKIARGVAHHGVLGLWPASWSCTYVSRSSSGEGPAWSPSPSNALPFAGRMLEDLDGLCGGTPDPERLEELLHELVWIVYSQWLLRRVPLLVCGLEVLVRRDLVVAVEEAQRNSVPLHNRPL